MSDDTTTTTGDVQEPADDELAALPADRLAAMLREKRRAETSVRAKLREAEGQRDALAGTVAAYQRDTFHTLAKQGGVLETALPDVDGQVQLEDVLGDDGLVDPGKVTTALAALRGERPHYFPSGPGSSGPSRPQGAVSTSSEASWGDVLGR